MTRRSFLALPAALAAQSEPPIRVSLMPRSLEESPLRFVRQLGVVDVRVSDTLVPGYEQKGFCDAEGLRSVRDRLAGFGIRFSSLYLNPRRDLKRNLLDQPGWQQDLDNVCRTIEGLAQAGVPTLNFNLLISRVIVSNKLHKYPGEWLPGYARNGMGRGGARLQTFDEDKARQVAEAPAGAVTQDQMWERIERFQRKVVPVATERRVRLACHPDDPPIRQHWGVNQVLNNRDALVRLVNIVPSPYNGLLLCLGTMQESGADVLDLIRYFGGKKLLFDIDFRAVQGKIPRYKEVFLDEGDLNMKVALRTLRDSGYQGPINPDHMPWMTGDPEDQPASVAWAVGYMKGLLDSL